MRLGGGARLRAPLSATPPPTSEEVSAASSSEDYVVGSDALSGGWPPSTHTDDDILEHGGVGVKGEAVDQVYSERGAGGGLLPPRHSTPRRGTPKEDPGRAPITP